VLAAALGATSEPSGRKTVLPQVRLPHNYYFREMYLPQATSGVGSPAWSPDGKQIAVSLEGSLWIVDPATGGARQLTDGPGYDYEPDWSPDGRFLAYASYQSDAVELRGLELGSGRTWPLTENRAVSVDPRFSPDGRSLVFVSTAYEGRFHVFRLPFGDGAPPNATRLTDDHDSGLPRYYYSRFDHYLSPAWSPDGREILLVSNRGRIWGSGGLWRMAAEPGAPMREVRYEETSWRARPDWAPDGRRIVYASYLGGQWHQLWLTTPDGDDVFPLTYGSFDATAPRFSRDGRAIAYVSNEDGQPALWTIAIPGGERRRVSIRERRYRREGGRVRIVVTEKGHPVPARLSVVTPDGRSFAPENAWRHADDGFDRAERKIEHGYFHAAGPVELRLPKGPATVEVTRGLEYRVARQTIDVGDGGTVEVAMSLERLDDAPARGVWSGDLHVHMNYGGAYRATPATLRAQAEAEDVHVVFDLIVDKEQRIPDIASFTGGLDPVSTPQTLIRHDQEFHTSFWGHLGLLGLRDHVLLPGYAGFLGTAAASLSPPNATLADLAHAQGALVGYVHPFDRMPEVSPAAEAKAYPLPGFMSGDPVELPVDVALGKLDYYEAVGFSDPLATNAVWYRLLNCGFRVPAGAGTDAMTNYASLRGPVGLNRVFVKSGPRLEMSSFLEGVRAGRTFATNGPLVELAVRSPSSGRWSEPGDELRLPRAARDLEARVSLRSIVPVDHLEVVANGQVAGSVPLTGDRTSASAAVRLPLRGPAWLVLRAYADRARHPVLDNYPFATTSPIYVTVDGAAVRSPEDARYFMAWIDRVREAAAAHPGWNTAVEKAEVLETLGRARDEFRKRAGER
jgi:Tol biopolymer transport system component